MHTLRKQGNYAVHALDGERQAAFDAIRLCHRLGIWFRAAVTNQPGLTRAFVPPRARQNEADALQAQIAEYIAKLDAYGAERDRVAARAAEEAEARLSAEERARLAEEERQVMAMGRSADPLRLRRERARLPSSVCNAERNLVPRRATRYQRGPGARELAVA